MIFANGAAYFILPTNVDRLLVFRVSCRGKTGHCLEWMYGPTQEMMEGRLVHVISSIQRGKRSGVLTAKRGEGIFP